MSSKRRVLCYWQIFGLQVIVIIACDRQTRPSYCNNESPELYTNSTKCPQFSRDQVWTRLSISTRQPSRLCDRLVSVCCLPSVVCSGVDLWWRLGGGKLLFSTLLFSFVYPPLPFPQPKSNFVHFYLQNLTASGNDSNDLPENQLAKFKTGYKT